MGNNITKQNYYVDEKLIIESKKEGVGVVKSGEGTFERGQAFKFDSSTMELVKTTANAGFVRVALEAGDATSEAVSIKVLIEGTINGFELKGVDFVVSENEMETPDTPITALEADGTLTAVTHEYKVAATNENGTTAPSTASTAVTPHAATAGYATGNTYANIAAINAALGDCSGTAKILTLNIDGVLTSFSFNADYSGAGAFASFAAFTSAVTFAGATTATPSATEPVKFTSNTTGTSSKVVVTSDATGLFSSKVEVAGTAIENKVKITLPTVANATGYKVWRSLAAADYTYRDATAAEIDLGYVVDDGTLTWTAGTAVTATDYASLKLAENHSLYVEEVVTGYEFRQAD